MVVTACIRNTTVVGRNWAKLNKLGGVVAGVQFHRGSDRHFYADNVTPAQVQALRVSRVEFTMTTTGILPTAVPVSNETAKPAVERFATAPATPQPTPRIVSHRPRGGG